MRVSAHAGNDPFRKKTLGAPPHAPRKGKASPPDRVSPTFRALKAKACAGRVIPLPVMRPVRVATPDLAGGQACMCVITAHPKAQFKGDRKMSKTNIADANGVDRKDVYTKVTNRIISDLEQGIRPWMKPWHADHAAGRI